VALGRGLFSCHIDLECLSLPFGNENRNTCRPCICTYGLSRYGLSTLHHRSCTIQSRFAALGRGLFSYHIDLDCLGLPFGNENSSTCHPHRICIDGQISPSHHPACINWLGRDMALGLGLLSCHIYQGICRIQILAPCVVSSRRINDLMRKLETR